MTLIFNSTLLVLISSIYDLYFLNDAFLFSLLFVGSRLKPFLMIKMVFGIDLEGKTHLIQPNGSSGSTQALTFSWAPRLITSSQAG